jgi:hypothetical protein
MMPMPVGRNGEDADGERADRPANGVGGPPAGRGAPPGAAAGGDRGGGGREQQDPAEREAQAGDVGRVQAGLGDVQAVRHDPEAGEDEAEGDGEADPRGARHMRPREDPGQRGAQDHRDAERRRRRPGQGQLEEVRDDERQPGDQQGALQRREAIAPRPAGSGEDEHPVGTLGRRGGCHRRSVPATRPDSQPARLWGRGTAHRHPAGAGGSHGAAGRVTPLASRL